MKSSGDEDEDSLDDPIQLNFVEDLPHIGDLQFLDTGIIDLDSGEDCEITDEYTAQHNLHINLNTHSLQKVIIKLVDCFRFSWYFDRSTRNIIDKKLADRIIDDERSIMTEDDQVEHEIDIIRIDTEVDSFTETPNNIMKNIINACNGKPQQSMRRNRNEIELQNAITQRNKTEIDLKRNKGLVGLKIQRSQVKGVIDKSKTQAEINQTGYIQDTINDPFTTALLNVGTSITPVFEDIVEKNKKNKPSECKLYDVKKNTNTTTVTCSLRLENTEKNFQNSEHEIAKDERKNDENSFLIMYNNTMKVSKEIVKEVIGIGNKIDLTMEKQKKSYDIVDMSKGMSLGKKKKTEAKQNKKDKEEMYISNEQRSVEGYKTTKLITAIPLTSKQRKKRTMKRKITDEKCESTPRILHSSTMLKKKSLHGTEKFKRQDIDFNTEDKEVNKTIMLPSKPKKPFDVTPNKYTENILQKNMKNNNETKSTQSISPLEEITKLLSTDQIKRTGNRITFTDSSIKNIPLTEQKRESTNVSPKTLPKANNHSASKPLNVAHENIQDSQPATTEQSTIPNASKQRRKQSINLIASIGNIEDYIKNNAFSKPIQVVAPGSHVKTPCQSQKEKHSIQTIITDRKDPESEKQVHKHSFMTVHKHSLKIPAYTIRSGQTQNNQAQATSKPLTVHNSMQSHILYSPQTSPRQRQPQMFPDAPILRHHVPLPQLNQPQFMYQQSGFIQSLPPSAMYLPPSAYRQGIYSHMLQNSQMTPGFYDVRSDKMNWSYNYPPPPPPPPPPPLPRPPPPQLPHHATAVDPLRALSAVPQNSSIIGKNNDGIVKKITITTPLCMKDTETNHDTVKIENTSDPNSTPLYDEVSPVAESVVPVSTKSEMLRVLDISSMQLVNSDKIDGISDNNLKRPYPDNSVFKNNDNSENKLSLPLRMGTVAAKHGNHESTTTYPKIPFPAESKGSSVVNSRKDSSAADTLNRTVLQNVSLTQPNENLKKTIPESQKFHHLVAMKTDERSRNNIDRPVKRKQQDTHGNLSEIPLPNKSVPVKYKPGPLSKKSKLIDTRVSPDDKISNEHSSKKYSLPILPIPTYDKILSEVPISPQRHVKNHEYLQNKFKDRLDARRLQKYCNKHKHSSKSLKKRLQYEDERSKKCEVSKKISLDEYKKRTVGERKTEEEARAYISMQKDITFKKKIYAMPRRVSNVDSDLGYDSDTTFKF